MQWRRKVFSRRRGAGILAGRGTGLSAFAAGQSAAPARRWPSPAEGSSRKPTRVGISERPTARHVRHVFLWTCSPALNCAIGAPACSRLKAHECLAAGQFEDCPPLCDRTPKAGRRPALRWMGSFHVLSDLLTNHEPCDRSAGHHPGQLAINRIHRAEAVLGAPIHGKARMPDATDAGRNSRMRFRTSSLPRKL